MGLDVKSPTVLVIRRPKPSSMENHSIWHCVTITTCNHDESKADCLCIYMYVYVIL